MMGWSDRCDDLNISFDCLRPYDGSGLEWA